MRYLAVIILILSAAAADGANVKMVETAVVSSRAVTLGDVASLEGAGVDESARLSGIVVGYVSRRDEGVTVSAPAVREALADAGVNLAEVTVTGASAARVVLTTGKFDSTAMADAIRVYLQGIDPRKSWRVSEIEMNFTAAAGIVPVVTEAHPRDVAGRVRFEVRDSRDLSKTAGHAFATISRSAQVVVAKRSIPGGRNISERDVEVAYVDGREAGGSVTDLSDCLGRKTLVTVRAGDVLRHGYLKSETLVKRGDEIVLEVSSGAIVVSVRTSALENASSGDVVRLRRLGGREEYLGKVVGPGRAVPISERTD